MKKDIQLYKALHNKQQRKALNRIADNVAKTSSYLKVGHYIYENSTNYKIKNLADLKKQKQSGGGGDLRPGNVLKIEIVDEKSKTSKVDIRTKF